MVDVSAFTKEGFVGSSTYHGRRVDLSFDDSGSGVFITREMAERLQVRVGSKVSLIVEDGSPMVVESSVAGIADAARVSDPRVYYALGREGGAVLRLRRS